MSLGVMCLDYVEEDSEPRKFRDRWTGTACLNEGKEKIWYPLFYYCESGIDLTPVKHLKSGPIRNSLNQYLCYILLFRVVGFF